MITTASTCSEPNPLDSRSGWVSDSRQWSLRDAYFPSVFGNFPFDDGLITEVNLPPGAAGKIVQLRWRFGSDCFGVIAGCGWRIYAVELISGYNNPMP
jgi:hypothetical protein